MLHINITLGRRDAHARCFPSPRSTGIPAQTWACGSWCRAHAHDLL